MHIDVGLRVLDTKLFETLDIGKKKKFSLFGVHQCLDAYGKLLFHTKYDLLHIVWRRTVELSAYMQ